MRLQLLVSLQRMASNLRLTTFVTPSLTRNLHIGLMLLTRLSWKPLSTIPSNDLMCQKCRSFGEKVELNRVPECRSMMEHWSVTEQWRSVTEQWRMWPQLMWCALALKNLVSVNFRLRRKEESCGAEVGWCGSKCGVMGSKCGAIGSKCGAKGIKMRSKVEQRILLLFDSKVVSCFEASSFKYRITEILEKGLY